jgi:hypothetical protein
MSDPVTKGLDVGVVAADVRKQLLSGNPPVLILCATSSGLLSKRSRELIRSLRTDGARTEFHAPDDSDTVLKSANRLLADMPLERLYEGAAQQALRVLVIDDGEKLAEPEVSSLRRLVEGLRGTVLRVVVLARHAGSRLSELPVAGLGERALVWDLESPIGELRRLEQTTDGTVPRAKRTQRGFSEPLTARIDDQADLSEAEDILAELARERSDAGAVVHAGSRRMRGIWIAMLGVVIVLLGSLGVVRWMTDQKAAALLMVYDCGLQPDRESVQVLIDQLGQGIPTRVSEQLGRYRLEAGPFKGKAAAEAARAQIWRIGACHVAPIIVSAATDVPRGNGG